MKTVVYSGGTCEAPDCYGELFDAKDSGCCGCQIRIACHHAGEHVPTCFGQFDHQSPACVGADREGNCGTVAACDLTKAQEAILPPKYTGFVAPPRCFGSMYDSTTAACQLCGLRDHCSRSSQTSRLRTVTEEQEERNQ